MTKFDMSQFGDDTVTTVEKPKTREQKVQEYRIAHAAEYQKACHDSQCTCTPTRAQMLIMKAYESPPVD